MKRTKTHLLHHYWDMFALSIPREVIVDLILNDELPKDEANELRQQSGGAKPDETTKGKEEKPSHVLKYDTETEQGQKQVEEGEDLKDRGASSRRWFRSWRVETKESQDNKEEEREVEKNTILINDSEEVTPTSQINQPRGIVIRRWLRSWREGKKELLNDKEEESEQSISEESILEEREVVSRWLLNVWKADINTDTILINDTEEATSTSEIDQRRGIVIRRWLRSWRAATKDHDPKTSSRETDEDTGKEVDKLQSFVDREQGIFRRLRNIWGISNTTNTDLIEKDLNQPQKETFQALSQALKQLQQEDEESRNEGIGNRLKKVVSGPASLLTMGNTIPPKHQCCDGSSPETQKANLITRAPPPKRNIKLLFGCLTELDQYDYIQKICEAIKTKHGKLGLAEVGLEFRLCHNPKTCRCKTNSAEVTTKVKPASQHRYEHGISDLSADDGDDDVEDSDSTNNDLNSNGDKEAIDLSIDVDANGDGANLQDRNGEESANDEDYLSKISKIPFKDEHFVPIGEPMSRDSSYGDLQQPVWGVRMGSERSANTAFTMFSLATHHTRTSSVSSGGANIYAKTCSMRLFHKSSNTMITETNHESFLAHGRMYDEVARLCMEFAQEEMIKEGNLEWQNVGDGVGALVTRDRCFKKPTLVVITGKGKVKAGIFSRRHLMTNGLDVSTALPFLRESKKRNMDIIMLDPNVNGTQKAMRAVQKSLERLFLENNAKEEEEEDVYILAHSMAGSQLVRFLHDNTFLQDTNTWDELQAGSTFLNQIKAIAFTDSNHNVNWVKQNPPVTNLLVGEASLYIRSHKVHDSNPKVLGQLQEDCEFWKHRFGGIKTIWGGTSEHALTNYTGFTYIWDHFDNFLEATS
jgi:hypothetical protein